MTGATRHDAHSRPGTNVELRQLQYFVAVAERLHFGQAAEALSIGQPAVSQQVARLERSLGIKLLDRTPRTVRLTEPGDRFLLEARKVLAALDHACESVDRTYHPGHRYRIGTCSGLGRRLDSFLAALDDSQPGCSVDLSSTPARSRLERVQAGQLDAAFVRGLTGVPRVELVEVWHDRLVVALPAVHPLSQTGRVSIAELGDLPLRVATRRANPSLVDAVLRRRAQAGVHPRRIPFEGGPVANLLAAVGAGAPSWTVIYASEAQMLQCSTVAFVATDPVLTVRTLLALPDHVTSRAAAPLLDACRVAAESIP